MISRKQHEENLEKYIELCRKGIPYTQIAKEIGVDLTSNFYFDQTNLFCILVD